MTNNPSFDRRSRMHSWIAVIINTFVGGVVGATFGTFGNFVLWLIGGLVLGAALGLANEALFDQARGLARWYRLRTVILVLGEVLLVIYVLIPAYGAYHATHPTRVPVLRSPASLGMAYEDVAIPTADGVTLRGWYIPSRNGAAIIALHGSDANRAQLLWHAQALSEKGYGVLLFDLRAHGESDGTVFPVTDASPDVTAAVAYLRSRKEIDPERIGAVGLSLGAEVILQAAAEDASLKALVADGASTNRIDDLLPLPPQYRLMYVAAPMWWMADRMAELMSGVPARPLIVLVGKIAPRPILFISSNQEPELFMNRRLYELAGPTAQLWELPDTGHVGGIFAHPEEYKQHMLSFFDAALLGQRPTASIDK
jgi:pimeloyl-ACP methyl ester carboxylesterase